MSKLAKSIAVVIIIYCLAWLVAFLSVVGFEPSLISSYFMLGWSLTGQELVSFVWLLAWPIFIALLLAYHFFGWRLSVSRERAA